MLLGQDEMNTTAQVILHVAALAALLSPFWFEITAPAREPYTKAYRRGRIAYLVALSLFVLCLISDILDLASLSDTTGLWLAIWLAVEIYWIIAFGICFLRKSEGIGKRKKGAPNDREEAPK